MKNTKPITNIQLTTLVVLRLLIGWHLLFEGISKLVAPNWSSAGFLSESQWILSTVATWIISNDSVLEVVDFLNTWGLIAIGAGLILGLFGKIASYAGVILLILYYLTNPPLTGLEYSMPTEGNYLIINKTLIEAVTLFLLSIFPTSHLVGLDLLLKKLLAHKNKKQ